MLSPVSACALVHTFLLRVDKPEAIAVPGHRAHLQTHASQESLLTGLLVDWGEEGAREPRFTRVGKRGSDLLQGLFECVDEVFGILDANGNPHESIGDSALEFLLTRH